MEFVSGNIFVREIRFDQAGASIEGHTHNFDHTTYVTKGRVRIEALNPDGTVARTRDLDAAEGQNWCLIKAAVKHQLTCLSPTAVAHCIYAHRNPQGEVVQEYDGWTPGYM